MRPVTFVRASSGYVAENEVEEAGVVERLGLIYPGPLRNQWPEFVAVRHFILVCFCYR